MAQNQNPFNSLGLFTYLRTYARRHNEEDPKSTVESWNECIERVVNACNSQLNVGFTETEKQEVFNMLYNLKCSVAGRFLWQLGTKTVDKLGLMSLQNCAFTTVDHPITPFTWVMNFLMLGAGCGYRITQEDLDKFPPVLPATITRDDNAGSDLIVPDSRQGWIKLLGKVLKAHFYSGSGFTYSCHCLRSKGAPIKSFGGLASGPDVLCDGIYKISEMLNTRAKSESNRLTTVEALDVMNIIGMIVVSGNVRRCLPKGALVHTESGLVPIENVKVGDKVLTTKEYHKVNNTFQQGVQPIVKIITEDGEFTCTPNHKMAVISGDTYIWKKAQNLQTEVDHLLFIIPHNEFIDLYPVLWRKNGNPTLTKASKVLEVEPSGEAETFDIEVDEMHEFFCNNFLTHNSAQIALGDCTDSEYLRAKRWDLGSIPNWRCYSNNSVICNDIEEVLNNEEFWEGYAGNGEPYGLINLSLSQSCGRLGEEQYPDPEVEGYNPCAEQSLANRETCCLAEIYLPNIESKEALIKYAKYLYRICKHSLALPCADSKETENIVHKNMRMGIGVTGYLQATEEQRCWLSDTYKALRQFDIEYSSLKGFPTSVKLTTCKPSGTLSILGGCTSGVHPGYAQYYIRRIRVSSESGLIKIAKEHGYHIEFVQNFDGSLDHSTQVISFPMSLPEGTVLAENCTAVQQLEWVKRLQTEWSDNSVSCTVYYRKEELPQIKEWLRENYNSSVKTVSFLLHSEHGFKQAPLEKISKEQYLEMVSNCRPITSVAGICYTETDEKNIGEGECAGGACPLK